MIFEYNFKPAGYLSSELWKSFPKSEKECSLLCNLNHSIDSVFASDGQILYISSFAILPEFRGKGNGFFLFRDALNYFEHNFNLTDFVLTVNEEDIPQNLQAEIKMGLRTELNYDDTAKLIGVINGLSKIIRGDVTKWSEWDIPWAEIDLLIGGSPCQGFSFAGKQ